MFKTTAVNSIAAVVAAGLVAALMVCPTLVVPEAKAEALVQGPVLQPDAVVKDAACSLQGWPYYEQGCQFDRRESAGETRTVRVIVLR